VNRIGGEDVLEPDRYDQGRYGQDDEYEPVERSRFHRRRDLAAAALIAVAAVVGGLLVWQNSDVRATTSVTADGVMTTPPPPTEFPPSLGESWRAESPATPNPVTIGPAVITGNGGEVAGRDPITGQVRWRYHRDLPLCTISSAWSMAITVYATPSNLLRDDDPRKAGGCSEVTAFDPATGERGRPSRPDDGRAKPDLGQRNSDAELGTRLLFDGDHVTTTGGRLLKTWRSDLVQTMEYGQVPALVNPDKQPRTGCTFGTVAVEESRIAVIERCPEDKGDRLTVYRATGDNNSDKPEVDSSVDLGVQGVRVVALSAECRIAAENENDTQRCAVVVAPDPARLLVFDQEGREVARHRLSLAPGDLPDADPPGHVVSSYEAVRAVYWYTGSRTIALSTADLRPLWTVEGAVGPGTMFAGQMLVPVVDGIAVLNPATGERRGTIPVDRGDYRGEVTMSTLGPMVFEQRGGTLVALR
jgi:hypothetical protein